MDSDPHTPPLIVPADPGLEKAPIPCKHAMCGTAQPILDAHSLHSHGCECLWLQFCAQSPSFSPGEPKVTRRAGVPQTFLP